MFDINNLKKCNDRYGHAEGDKLIKNASRSIRETFGGFGQCYRIGGDEFAVVIYDTSKEAIEGGIEKWKQNLDKMNESLPIHVEISYGYAIRDSLEISEQEVFKTADANMYRMKQQMKSNSLE